MENVLQKPPDKPETASQIIRTVRRKYRRRYSAEDKIRIVLEGVRKEIAISDLCRREGIHPHIYYKWLMVKSIFT